ncbi:hypothetical protein INS49_007632 [Diaporthe citri]|uniref:uncharacterized protein n=1 Tax=Diaporthe citri TaxID=83186 RepID=UPI001C7E2062|nr:uncharacterized protein INS49_007632 [Diaporthe citri]KAG6362540.1 hypothetical protein INS49_007632 [Diaporthe citri]
MAADGSDYPLPASDASMQCLRAFLKRFNMFGLFQACEIMDVFQHHVHETQSSQDDVQLLKAALEHFDSTEPQHDGKMASDAMAIMYKVAQEAVEQPHGLLQQE